MSMNSVSALFASIVLSSAPVAAHAGDVPPQTPVAPTTTAPVAPKLTVQVIGRVKHPGTLRLDAGARLSDALTAAGADFETLIARVGGAPVPDTDCVLGGPELAQGLPHAHDRSVEARSRYAIDVSVARQQHDLRYDPLLQDDDEIYVPQCRPKVKVILTPPTFPTPSTAEPADFGASKRRQDTAPGVRNARRSARGISSVGRALAWHARGQEFESPILHQPAPLRTRARLPRRGCRGSTSAPAARAAPDAAPPAARGRRASCAPT